MGPAGFPTVNSTSGLGVSRLEPPVNGSEAVRDCGAGAKYGSDQIMCSGLSTIRTISEHVPASQARQG
jgi:hypothetical protein